MILNPKNYKIHLLVQKTKILIIKIFTFILMIDYKSVILAINNHNYNLIIYKIILKD